MPMKKELVADDDDDDENNDNNDNDENDRRNLLPPNNGFETDTKRQLSQRHLEIAAIADADDNEEDIVEELLEDELTVGMLSASSVGGGGNNNNNNNDNMMHQATPIRMNCTTTESDLARRRRRVAVALRSLCCILIYYAFSIGLTFYNRSLFKTYNYPLVITLVHMCIKLALAVLIRSVLMLCYKTRRAVLLDCNTYLTRLLPTSLTSSVDIGFSNWSLEYITRSSILAIVVCISFGLFLFTYELTEFNAFGFALAITASFASGLRWTLAQSITQKHELGLSNPIDMIYHVQPGMIMFLLPLAIYIEGWPTYMSGKQAEVFHNLMDNFIWVIVGSFLAFFLESSEYLVVTYTSSLTLSVSGVFKEICTLYLAVVWAHNKLNTVNAFGLVVCLTGICFHIYFKAKSADELSDEPRAIRRRVKQQDVNTNDDHHANNRTSESTPSKKFLNFKFKSTSKNKQQQHESVENISLVDSSSYRQPLLLNSQQ